MAERRASGLSDAAVLLDSSARVWADLTLEIPIGFLKFSIRSTLPKISSHTRPHTRRPIAINASRKTLATEQSLT